jgi:O-antigen/teichoic acid export membrane protein
LRVLVSNKKRSIFEEIFIFLSNNFAAAIFGILTSIVLARLLGPENKGIITAALVFPNIIINISRFGIRQSTIVFVGKNEFPDHQILSSILYISLATSVAGIIFCFFGYQYLLAFDKDLPLLYILLILLYLPLRILCNFFNAYFIGKLKFRVINISRLGGAVYYLLLILLFVYILKSGVLGVFISLDVLTISLLLFLILLLIKYKFITSIIETFKLYKHVIYKLISMGMLYAIALLVIQLNLRADILFLKYFKDNLVVGYYSVAVAIAEMMWQFPIAMGIVIISKTANSDDISKTISDLNILFRITLIIVILAGICLFFLTPFFIPYFYGLAFTQSVPMVQVIIPGIVFFALMFVLMSFIIGKGKPKVVIYIGLPALLVNLIANYFLIPIYGGIGAAVATDISYFIALLCTMLYYFINFKVQLWDLMFIKKSDLSLIGKLVRKKLHK